MYPPSRRPHPAALMDHAELRQQLIDYARRLNSSGLTLGMSGNISVRVPEGLMITPSGVDYNLLTPDQMVVMRLDGETLPDQRCKPSSEWRFHCGLLEARDDMQAVVHAHPTYCTALACTGREIPAFHYMVAIAGGENVPLVPYDLFGTKELSESVVDAMRGRNACLMANHGMIAVGRDLSAAFSLALEVENLARQYSVALALGGVQQLTDPQMADVLEKFKGYGQRT